MFPQSIEAPTIHLTINSIPVLILPHHTHTYTPNTLTHPSPPPHTHTHTQEERTQNSGMRSELSKLEAALEKSSDQTRGELRTMKQMFEQSEQSRTASE